MRASALWSVLLGVGAASAGIVIVEILLAVGPRPLAPVGWPSVLVILAAALRGFPAWGGGATATLVYFALNFAAAERFPAFYSGGTLPWVWLVAFSLLGFVTAVLRDRAARASEAPFRAIAENLGALVSYIDSHARFRFNNRLYESWFGLPRERITGRTMREVLGDEAYAGFEPYVRRALAGERVEFEAVLRHGGTVRHVQGIYVPDLRLGGRVAGVYGILSDISRMKAAEQELTLLAHYDPLTGVMNRTLFADRLAQAIARGRRSGLAPALLYLDIDRFKAINDTHGHDAGDAVLKEFAARLRGCLRETDTVGRLGGDEFVVLLEGVHGEAGALQVARKIIAAVQAPLDAGDAARRRFAVTTSVGIALHDGSMDAEAWIKSADGALYEAKAAGRNTCRLAQASR